MLFRSTQFAELGFTGVLIPGAQGGLGLGHVEAGVVLEEIGRNLSPSPFLTTAVAAVAALKGTAQRERWFPGILSGETVAALAIDERAKHGDAIGMKAERSGNGFKLTGTKQFVAHGHVADLLIVDGNPAENLRYLYPFGAIRMDENQQKYRTKGIIYTIKDGVVVDNAKVMEEVARMVAESKVNAGPDVVNSPFLPFPEWMTRPLSETEGSGGQR